MPRIPFLVIIAAAVAACVGRSTEREGAPPRPDESLTHQQRALAALQANNGQTRETASLCEQAGGQLTPDLRARCALAHLALAREALDRNSYEQARSALAFAETEGGDLTEIRKQRKRIPGYEKIVSGNTSAAESTPSNPSNRRQAAVSSLNTTFSSSLLQGWDIHASSAGSRCDVLLITFYVKMESSMIEALHEGSLIYGRILPGGVRSVASANGFRGVVYRDGYDTTWTYGNVSSIEGSALRVCN